MVRDVYFLFCCFYNKYFEFGKFSVCKQRAVAVVDFKAVKIPGDAVNHLPKLVYGVDSAKADNNPTKLLSCIIIKSDYG